MRKRLCFAVALGALSTLLVLPLHAVVAQSDEAFIKYRQKVMSSNGANIGSIGDIVKNKLPYAGNIAGHARNINTNAKMIAAAFKKKLHQGKTDAKPEIWQKWSEFEDAAKNLQEQSAKLADVASSGDMTAIGAQLKQMGKACGNCHKKFRKKKKESYKRKR